MIADEIYAIWLREVKKLLADKLALAVGIVLPFLVIIIIGAGVDSFVKLEISGLNYTSFLGPGIIALWAMSGALGIGNSFIEDKQGFIKELLVAPVSRASILLGKVLSEMSFTLGITLIATFFFLHYIGTLSLITTAKAALIMILIALGFYGFGLIMGLIFKKAKSYQLFSGLIITAIIFLSGIFFPAQNLPIWMKTAFVVNPLTYGVDALRQVMTGYSEFGLFYDLIVLAVFGLVMVTAGTYLFSKTSTQ